MEMIFALLFALVVVKFGAAGLILSILVFGVYLAYAVLGPVMAEPIKQTAETKKPTLRLVQDERITKALRDWDAQ